MIGCCQFQHNEYLVITFLWVYHGIEKVNTFYDNTNNEPAFNLFVFIEDASMFGISALHYLQMQEQPSPRN